MDLETIEILSVSGEGAGGSASGGGNHWSRTLARPRYALNKDEVKEQQNTHRFTCFDVAERVESDHDILFAGRVINCRRSRNVVVNKYEIRKH